MPLKIGLLLPSSMMFPLVDQDFLAGLQGALTTAGAEVVYHLECTGASADRELVKAALRKLLLTQRPDVVIGIVGAPLLPDIRHLAEQYRTPLLVCDLGGDLPLHGEARSPFLFCNSLNIWQSAYALGYWGGLNFGPRGAMAAAFHEAGFGMVRALAQGYADAGGDMVATQVTHRESATQDPGDAVRSLLDTMPDIIFGLYSGREGISFMQRYAAHPQEQRAPLLATPMLGHGHWLDDMPEAIHDMYTACSWAPGLHAEAEERFRIACADAEPSPSPRCFMLLGYEAGQILLGGLSRLEGGVINGSRLRDALEGVSFSSPRGRLQLHESLGEVISQDHLVRITRDEDGARTWQAVATLDLPEGYAGYAADTRRQDAKVGWLNPYLVN